VKSSKTFFCLITSDQEKAFGLGGLMLAFVLKASSSKIN
jgi:hypothetical protein